MPTLFVKKAPWYIDKLMHDLGLTLDQACGILGNIGHECGGFLLMQEKHPVAGQGGYGICQWTGPRRAAFFAFCAANKLSVDSDEGNYAYLVHELKTSEAGAIAALKRTTNITAATEIFEQHFERAGVVSYADRITYAKLALAAYQAAKNA